MGLSAFGIFELLFRLKLLFRFASLAVPNGHHHRPLPASSNICNHQGLSAWSMPSPRGRCVLCFVLDYNIRLHGCFTFCCNCLWFVVVQSLSDVQLFATPRTAARQAPLSSTVPWGLLRFMSIKSVILSHLLLPPFPFPSVFPSIRVFSSKLAFRIRWPKYCSFSITPSNKYSGLISFRIDWFVLLAVHGTLKSLLQHHNSKASILWHSEPLTTYASSYTYTRPRKLLSCKHR